MVWSGEGKPFRPEMGLLPLWSTEVPIPLQEAHDLTTKGLCSCDQRRGRRGQVLKRGHGIIAGSRHDVPVQC